MAGRIDERAARLLRGEAQGVVDAAATHLVVAGEARQDRQPGGVGGGPAARPHAVGRRFQTAPEPARQRAPPCSG